MPKSNGDASSMPIGDMIAFGLKLRAAKEKAEEKVSEINKMIDQSDAEIMTFLNATGQTSAKTEQGTARWELRENAACEDPDKFMAYVGRTGELWLLNRSPNTDACREFCEKHDKLPPGVKINSRRKVYVTKLPPAKLEIRS